MAAATGPVQKVGPISGLTHLPPHQPRCPSLLQGTGKGSVYKLWALKAIGPILGGGPHFDAFCSPQCTPPVSNIVDPQFL